MSRSKEFQQFNDAMTRILHADPQQVKAQMEREQIAHAEKRKAKGERKRGRKSDKPKENLH